MNANILHHHHLHYRLYYISHTQSTAFLLFDRFEHDYKANAVNMCNVVNIYFWNMMIHSSFINGYIGVGNLIFAPPPPPPPTKQIPQKQTNKKPTPKTCVSSGRSTIRLMSALMWICFNYYYNTQFLKWLFNFYRLQDNQNNRLPFWILWLYRIVNVLREAPITEVFKNA